MEMKKLFPNEYNYTAEAFYYPEDNIIIKNKFKNYSFNLNDLWLVKPTYGSCGEDIYFAIIKKNN